MPEFKHFNDISKAILNECGAEQTDGVYVGHTSADMCVSVHSVIDWIKASRPTRYKIGHFGDVLPSQLFGLAL